VVASVLGIAAFTTGITLGVFFLGMYARRVGERAALAGFVAGLAAMTAIYFLTRLAWPWYALVGSAITFAAGWAASLAMPLNRGEGASESERPRRG
jgi:SSS family solute:Na+ symporter